MRMEESWTETTDNESWVVPRFGERFDVKKLHEIIILLFLLQIWQWNIVISFVWRSICYFNDCSIQTFIKKENIDSKYLGTVTLVDYEVYFVSRGISHWDIVMKELKGIYNLLRRAKIMEQMMKKWIWLRLQNTQISIQ